MSEFYGFRSIHFQLIRFRSMLFRSIRFESIRLQSIRFQSICCRSIHFWSMRSKDPASRFQVALPCKCCHGQSLDLGKLFPVHVIHENPCRLFLFHDDVPRHHSLQNLQAVLLPGRIVGTIEETDDTLRVLERFFTYCESRVDRRF